MTSQGPNYPGTASQISNAGASWGSPWQDCTNPWTGASNITAGLSGTFATISDSGTNGEALAGTGYGFSLPSGATVNGVQVAVYGKWPGSISKQPTTFIYQLSPAIGGPQTDTSQPFTSTLGAVNYGGTTSVPTYWGSISYSTVNGGTFGFIYQPLNFGNSNILSIETFGITVYYTATAGAVQQMLGMLGIGCSLALAAEIARSVTFYQRSIPGGRPRQTFADQVFCEWRRRRGHGWFKRRSILVPESLV